MKTITPQQRLFGLIAVVVIAAPLFVLIIQGFGSLASIPLTPETTPAQWLADHPHIAFGSGAGTSGSGTASGWILAKPSSSAIVYLLALLTLGVGIRLLAGAGESRARFWWGAGLILWGIGTVLAGTSYQAFAYEIKIAGRQTAAWTSWWEVTYMLFETASVNTLLVGVAYAVTGGRTRKGLTVYALANTLLYTAVLITGSLLADKFLVSFELMLLFCFPGLAAAFVLSLRSYRRIGDTLNKRLLQTWIILGAVTVLYYAYLLAGIGPALWEGGLWFSANDVLHIGLILWMLFIDRGLTPRLHDQDQDQNQGQET